MALALTALIPAASLAAVETGQPLAEALRELEDQGLRVIYSTRLVGDDLRVDSPPAPGPLPEMLVSLLAPHGLDAQESAEGTWVVVRAAEPRASDVRPVRSAIAASLSEEIVVTPSHYALLKPTEAEKRQFLSREDVHKLPHLSDDLYRAVAWLPGTANADVTADFHIRGGEAEEVLVILDGAEIYDPFHLKDINIFSTLDAEAVGGVDFLTGGFPVEYGDRMSGVMDISTYQPSERRRTTLGLSFVNARLLATGLLRDDRGSWMVSFRRGYLDIVLDIVNQSDDDLSPVYYDLMSQVEYRLSDRHALAFNVQGAYDELDFFDDNGTDEAHTREDGAYLWLRLRSFWGPRLYSQSVLSATRLWRRRTGVVRGFEIRGDIDDRREFDYLAFKQDWGREGAGRHFLKWGLDARTGRGDVEFTSSAWVDEPTYTGGGPPVERFAAVDVEPSGESFGVYLADRVRLSDRATAELGVRWDRQSLVDDDQLSPRVNLAWAMGRERRSLLRLSWGRFYQSQGLHELQAEDGVDVYFPAQLAEHRLIGFEHALPFGGALRGAGLRVELYQKVMSHLRPRYENLFEPVEYLAEIWPDRVRVAPESAEARGVEVLVKQPGSGRVSWWVSYVRASVEDEIDGVSVPRSWDQEHTVTFSVNVDRKKWSFNVSGIYHTGWPTTEVTLETIDNPDGTRSFVRTIGPRNAERFPDYYRLDFRASRRVELRRGEVELSLEVTNVLDRRNVCCKDDHDLSIVDGQAELLVREEYWMPFLPSFGVSWEF